MSPRGAVWKYNSFTLEKWPELFFKQEHTPSVLTDFSIYTIYERFKFNIQKTALILEENSFTSFCFERW